MIILLAVTYACTNNNAPNNTDNTENHEGHDHHDHEHHHSDSEEKGDGIHYGLKAIDAEGAVSVSEILTKLEKGENLEEIVIEEDYKVEGLKGKIEGTIVEMCQMSGCWFTFETEDNKIITVTMKEHKPTPKQWAGKSVIVEGAAYKEIISIEELRRQAKDEGASRDEISKIKEPQTNYHFIADGAILKK